MNKYIEKIQSTIAPLREQIINHPVYSIIDTVDDLKIFMQYHVYAVWDFMSLLKALQNNLTCTSVPWFPKGSAAIRYFINEIVVAEEADTDLKGNKKSHFELYLEGMEQCGANAFQIQKFLSVLEESRDFNIAYIASDVPQEARHFIDFTFDIINSGKDYLQAAIFTFGREDLIPAMFLAMIQDINKDCLNDQLSVFKYYLERHIAIDGDHHSHLALEMTSSLCGTDEDLWQQVEQAIISSLQKRIELWDGVYKEVMLLKKTSKMQTEEAFS